MGEALEVGEERMATAILFIVDVDNAIEEAAIGALPPIRLRNTQRLPKSSLEPGRLTNWPRAGTGRWSFVRRRVLILGVEC